MVNCRVGSYPTISTNPEYIQSNPRACISIPRAVLRNPSGRNKWLSDIKHPILAKQLNLLWIGYDATVRQVVMARGQLSVLGRKYDIIKLWGKLPGIGLIRATTLFAYLDTPWRFKKKNKLWKYCGIGLQRTTSGTDKKRQT